MSLLRFTDARGVEWEVWEVDPQRVLADRAPDTRSALPPRWLCFESATERRRLADFPHDWANLPVRQLDELCRAATPARPYVVHPLPDQPVDHPTDRRRR